MRLTAECPFCDKKFEAEIMWRGEIHRWDARRRLDLAMEGHIVNCIENPNAFQSQPIPEYPVQLED